LGVPLGILLGARSWIWCFSEVRVRILKTPFSYSPLYLCWVQPLDMDEPLMGPLCFPKRCLLVP